MTLLGFMLLAATLEKSVCPVEIPSGTVVDCYLLAVPENRAKSGSREIRLPVLIIRSPNAQKKADPVLYTAGGPGGSTLRNMKGRVRIPFLRDRDVVLLEQRGNRYATPWLSCPEFNDVQRSLAEDNVAGEESTRRQVRAATTCRARLVADGIDLDGYNTSESAADIGDLRRLLALPEWNLWGLSYSAELMLEVMRRHPEGIRSVILDSVLPPNVSWDEFGQRALMRALHEVFTDCEMDVACSRAHPGVRANFHALIARLNAKPRRTTLRSADGKRDLAYTIGGRNVAEAMAVLLNEAESALAIPHVIDAAMRGDFAPFDAALQGNIGEGGYSWGARLSVWCHDAAPFNDTAQTQAEARRFPEWRGYPSATVPAAVCGAWNVGAAPAEFAEPVRSAIPTLVYAGSYDPNTPPHWGRMVTQSLTSATFVEFAGQVHNSGETRCGWTTMMRFLDDPAKPVDLTCATRFPTPAFAP